MHSDNGVSGVREHFFTSLQFRRWKAADSKSNICCPALFIAVSIELWKPVADLPCKCPCVVWRAEDKHGEANWSNTVKVQPNTPKASASASDMEWLKHFKCLVPTLSCLSDDALTSLFHWKMTNEKYFFNCISFPLSFWLLPHALWLVHSFLLLPFLLFKLPPGILSF